MFKDIALIWFRQDLRLIDNPAFISACNHHETVIPLYILDESTLLLGGAQRWWLHHSLMSLNDSLQKRGLSLLLRQGNALEVIKQLVQKLPISTIYWNRLYEPLAIKRDKEIKSVMLQSGIEVKSSNGSLLIEPWAVQNKSGHYFKVFTPFWKHCLQTITIPNAMSVVHQAKAYPVQSERLEEWNLLPKNPNWASAFATYWQPGEKGAQKKLTEFIHHHLNDYQAHRDMLAANVTSKLSPHLHFGEISPGNIWRAVELAKLDGTCNWSSAECFLTEIGWREFSYHLLYHFPSLPDKEFKKKFACFPWRIDGALLKRWQKGTTGYPLVDAGMRELWSTGYMHNRARMVTASFLTKDLLIDWRLGADWFLDTLVDADLANNSTSWQWVAGCGADAAPYFRIFNPALQSQRFDPDGKYIRKWVPELAHVKSQYIHQPWIAHHAETGLHIGKDYPKPIINHQEARDRALQYYKALEKTNFNGKRSS